MYTKKKINKRYFSLRKQKEKSEAEGDSLNNYKVLIANT